MDKGRLWLSLNDLAQQMDIEVRMEALEDSEGYRAASGLCRLGPDLVAFIDVRLSIEERCDRLGALLAQKGGLDDIFIRPAVRNFLKTFMVPKKNRE